MQQLAVLKKFWLTLTVIGVLPRTAMWHRLQPNSFPTHRLVEDVGLYGSAFQHALDLEKGQKRIKEPCFVQRPMATLGETRKYQAEASTIVGAPQVSLTCNLPSGPHMTVLSLPFSSRKSSASSATDRCVDRSPGERSAPPASPACQVLHGRNSCCQSSKGAAGPSSPHPGWWLDGVQPHSFTHLKEGGLPLPVQPVCIDVLIACESVQVHPMCIYCQPPQVHDRLVACQVSM
jgi:hypothetical protein